MNLPFDDSVKNVVLPNHIFLTVSTITQDIFAKLSRLQSSLSRALLFCHFLQLAIQPASQPQLKYQEENSAIYTK